MTPLEARLVQLEKLEEQRGAWAQVRRVVSSLATLREENHFSGKIAEAMRGHP